MTATLFGPYEHRGAYRLDVVAQLENTEPQWFDAPAEAEQAFDTSGMSGWFCEYCEHDPCVAGGMQYCQHDPRFIVTERIHHELYNLLDWKEPYSSPLQQAARGLAYSAWDRDQKGDSALRVLARTRDELRAINANHTSEPETQP